MKAERTDADDSVGELPTTAYLVLGVLVINDEELSAAEIKTRADFSFAQFYWAPAISHIRRELNRLLGLQMVTEREIPTGPNRSTLRYESTTRGDRLLEEWTASLPEYEPVVVKHPLLLRIWFAQESTDPLHLLEMLDRHAERTQQRIDELRWGMRRGEELGLAAEPHVRFSGPVVAYMLRNQYAELANCQQLRDDLARGTERDPARRVSRDKGELRRRTHPVEEADR